MKVIGGLLAAVGGAAVAVQGRLNGTLGHALHDGILAALISFVGGLVVLVLLVPTNGDGRRGIQRLRDSLRITRTGRLRWWQCFGGTCGAFLVASQGLTVATIGVAMFTVAVVTGQVISSLLVDRAGLGPGEPRALSGPRVAGALIAVVAVTIAVSPSLTSPNMLLLALLPLIAGGLLGWQQAMNGLVREAADSASVTTLLNFTTGTLALVAVASVDVAVRGLPSSAPSEWWLYAGGLLGIVGVGGAIASVRFIGVLMVGLCAVCGQLVGAVALDAVSGSLKPTTLVGTGLTLVSVAVAALPRRRAAAVP